METRRERKILIDRDRREAAVGSPRVYIIGSVIYCLRLLLFVCLWTTIVFSHIVYMAKLMFAFVFLLQVSYC